MALTRDIKLVEKGLNALRKGLCTTTTPKLRGVASLGYRGLPLVRKTERKGRTANRPYQDLVILSEVLIEDVIRKPDTTYLLTVSCI